MSRSLLESLHLGGFEDFIIGKQSAIRNPMCRHYEVKCGDIDKCNFLHHIGNSISGFRPSASVSEFSIDVAVELYQLVAKPFFKSRQHFLRMDNSFTDDLSRRGYQSNTAAPPSHITLFI
jgi:hypothetical protein